MVILLKLSESFLGKGQYLRHEEASYSHPWLCVSSLRTRTWHIATSGAVLLPHLFLSRMHCQGFDLEILTCVSYANSKFATFHRSSTALPNCL